MKVKSNVALTYSSGRSGMKTGIIEIVINPIKNVEAQTVNISITDYAETEPSVPMNMGGKSYLTQSNEIMTYAEYDAMLAAHQAESLFEETGSALEDVLIQEYLLDKVVSEFWYNSLPENWVKVPIAATTAP